MKRSGPTLAQTCRLILPMFVERLESCPAVHFKVPDLYYLVWSPLEELQ